MFMSMFTIIETEESLFPLFWHINSREWEETPSELWETPGMTVDLHL